MEQTAVKTTALVSHEDTSRHDTGWKHPDHQGRLPAIVRALQRDMVALWEPVLQLEAVPAAMDDLLRVHPSSYLARIREAAGEAEEARETRMLDGVPVSGATWDAVLASVGGALTAIDAVLAGEARNAFVLARPPGRGAGADTPGEFGFVNTVAVAARHLREARGMARVLVVAWAARPPRALAELLGGDEGIRLVSLHPHPRSFPPSAESAPVSDDEEGATMDGVALAPGTDGAAFAAAMHAVLDAFPADQSPDFVILSAGFDILAADPHGALAVEPEAVYGITRVLREWADVHAGGRLVSVLEGGYDAAATARAAVQHVRALAGVGAA